MMPAQALPRRTKGQACGGRLWAHLAIPRRFCIYGDHVNITGAASDQPQSAALDARRI
jgi:hypothetical protein